MAVRKKIKETSDIPQNQSAIPDDYYKMLFQQSVLGIGITDFQGAILDINPVCMKLLNISNNEALGLNLFKAVALTRELKKKLTKEKTLEYETQLEPGRSVTKVKINLLKDDKNNPGYLVQIQDITELKDLNKKLKDIGEKFELIASIDPLTGSVNRKTGHVILEKNLSYCRRNLKSLTVCMIDINNIQTVNDFYGQNEGDDLLQLISGIIMNTIRNSDTLSRFGGDEFMLILPECNAVEARNIIDRINFKLAGLNEKKYKPYLLSFSFGIEETSSSLPLSLEDLLEKTERKMNAAKSAYKEKLGLG